MTQPKTFWQPNGEPPWDYSRPAVGKQKTTQTPDVVARRREIRRNLILELITDATNGTTSTELVQATGYSISSMLTLLDHLIVAGAVRRDRHYSGSTHVSRYYLVQ